TRSTAPHLPLVFPPRARYVRAKASLVCGRYLFWLRTLDGWSRNPDPDRPAVDSCVPAMSI
ncbi:MAG: hypothetical protein R6Y91_01760, partial [Desulfohalobium sp.]